MKNFYYSLVILLALAGLTGKAVFPQSQIIIGANASVQLGSGTSLFVETYSGNITGEGQINNTPLPVELTSLSAMVKNKTVLLRWETATESNSAIFEVQRKTEIFKDWKSLHSQQAAGNSNAARSYQWIDQLPESGRIYYRLKMIDRDGVFKYSAEAMVNYGVPSSFSLSQNYPNPFNPITKIEYALPATSPVVIRIYAITGETVETFNLGNQSSGYYTFSFDGSHLATGVYIYSINAGSFSSLKKMMLLK